MEALGLGWETLRARCPRLIWCSLTPFGRTGPYAGYRAHDLVVVAMGGNPSMTGDPDRAPVRCSMPTGYYAACPDAAAGIAMALCARERSGRGQLVDVSMHECQLASLVTAPGSYSLNPQLRGRTGARLGGTREIWRAKDGDVSFGLRGGAARAPSLEATVAWMAEEGMAPAWLREIDWQKYNHNLLSPEEIARLEAAFTAFFATKTRRELFEQSLARRIMLAPCNDAREILEQPQLRSRDLFTTIEYPELGARIEHPGFFAKASRGRIGIRRRAPRIGEHNAEIYGELGLDAGALAELTRHGVI
jgi:benzylsuccinate CoA-transferase BbsE subunit